MAQQTTHKFVLGTKEFEDKVPQFQYDRGWYSIIDIVDEEKNVIYTARDTEFEEENIRMWLDKGLYSIYFSEFEGGSIYVDVSFE